MKTVGTITFHDTRNYGALLQCYALQQVLIRIGYQAEVIDYRNFNHYLGKVPLLKAAKHRCWAWTVDHVLGRKRAIRTKKFIQENIRLSSRCYRSYRALQSSPPLYDCYITGSDQVWNPVCIHGDDSFFLSFAPAQARRISYGASFGVTELELSTRQLYEKWLKKIDFISVRETSGQKLVKEITGIVPQVVIDPVFLLPIEQWENLLVPSKRKQYLLCYHMPGDRQIEEYIWKLAEKLAGQHGLQIVHLGLKEYKRIPQNGLAVWDAGPREFLGWIHGASLVITNSFHGSVFSLLFGKPFFSLCNRGVTVKKQYVTRLEAVLQTFNLTDHLLDIHQSLDSVASPEGIDLPKTAGILEQQRSLADSFLRSSLL